MRRLIYKRMQKVDKMVVLLSFSASSFCASPACFYSWRFTIWSINLVWEWKEDRLKKIDWSRSLTQFEKRLNDKSIFWSKKNCFIIKRRHSESFSQNISDIDKKARMWK